jgi:uncharacterized C2H2 Zn-finger protein
MQNHFGDQKLTPFRSLSDAKPFGGSEVDSILEFIRCETISGIISSLHFGVYQMRNHFGDQKLTPFWSFGYWELEESRVETLDYRSPKVAKCGTPKSRNRHINRSFGYQDLEESRVETLDHRSPKVVKCRTLKSRNRHINRSFGYRKLEESRVETLDHKSLEVAKGRTPKSRNRHINQSFGYRELEESRVETLHHRSPEVPK